MALDTSKIKLPHQVVTEILNKAKNSSTIAALSPSMPQTFTDVDHLIFSPSAEAEVVAEGATKGSYEQAFKPVEGKRVKIQTTTRVTSELKWADEDNQLEILASIIEDQRSAMGRALDYVVYHAVNPRSGLALSGFTALTASDGVNSVTAGDDPTADIDALTDALLEWDINGFAMSRPYASRLRKIRVPSTGQRLYPEIPLSLNAGSLDGIPAAVSSTVSGVLAKTKTGVLGIMGDFSLIKWGMVRDMYSELIEYGDPDGTGVDLKAHNQIAFRTESVFSYAVLDPSGFAVLTDGASA